MYSRRDCRVYTISGYDDPLPTIPVMTAPMPSVNLNMWVTLAGSKSLSGTFLWVMMTAESVPLTPIEVVAPWFTALKAYSVYQERRIWYIKNTNYSVGSHWRCILAGLLTNLIESAFGREDGDVSIETSATASRHFSPHAKLWSLEFFYIDDLFLCARRRVYMYAGAAGMMDLAIQTVYTCS